MKVLLHENTQNYQAAVSKLNEGKAPLLQALAAYAALGLAVTPTTADLSDLYSAPKVFLERVLTGGQPVKLAGELAVEPGKVFDLLHKPAGTDAFLKKIAAIRQEAETRQGLYPDTRAYDLQKGELIIKSAVLAQLLENSRTYATTQKQVEEWGRLQVITKALNEIRQSGGFGGSFDAAHYLQEALAGQGNTQYSNGELRPNHEYIVQQYRLR